MRHLWPTKEQAKEQGWGPEEQEALKNEGYIRHCTGRLMAGIRAGCVGPTGALNYRATVASSLFCSLFSVSPCSSDWENETEEAR